MTADHLAGFVLGVVIIAALVLLVIIAVLLGKILAELRLARDRIHDVRDIMLGEVPGPGSWGDPERARVRPRGIGAGP